MGILVYEIISIFLFAILKDESIKNILLIDCLYVFKLMKSLYFYSKSKSLNQYYLED
jgi:hypothetical protein